MAARFTERSRREASPSEAPTRAWPVAVRAALLAAALIPPGCAPETADPSRTSGPPNVLLFTIDTFRADRAGCLGHPNGLTPSLDRVARGGRIAREAFAPAPLTAVSHASMLTGLEPPAHGVRENGFFTLDAEIPTLATLLREHGFATGAFVSAFPLDRRFGFDAGFDIYDDVPDGQAGSMLYAERPAAATVDSALTWIQTVPSHLRWFAWVHVFDPHRPRSYPAALRTLPRASDYDREIREADRQFRRLLQGATEHGGGRAPVIAIVSDHGEGQGDHGEISHGLLLYEELLRGLFALSAPPKSDESTRLGEGPFRRVVRYSDLVPTLLDVLALPFSERIDGHSLLADEASAVSSESRGAYSETYYPALHYQWSPLLGWRDERWSFIDGPDPELFDRVADPGERRNVIARHPDVAARMSARIAELKIEPNADAVMSPDAEAREKLAALGYLSTTETFRYDSTKDPKALVDAANELFRGITLLSQGQPRAAQRFLLRANEADPDNVSVLFYLATSFRELGHLGTAMKHYRHAVELSPLAAEAFAHLAVLEFQFGRPDEAFSLLERGLAASPAAFVLLMTAGDLSRDVERHEDAQTFYELATGSEPRRYEPWAGLARISVIMGDHGAAQEQWRKATELDTGDALAGQSLSAGQRH